MVPAYSTGDARTGWRLSRRIDLSLAGQNLFQPAHVEYGGDPYGLVRIKRSVYAKRDLEQETRGRNAAISLCPIASLGLIPCPRCGAADQPPEYQVKAAFLLNCIKFIEWPGTAFRSLDSPVCICVLGDDPFGTALDETVAGEVVSGRKVADARTKRAPLPAVVPGSVGERAGKRGSQNPSWPGAGSSDVGRRAKFYSRRRHRGRAPTRSARVSIEWRIDSSRLRAAGRGFRRCVPILSGRWGRSTISVKSPSA
jgi:hypothetical protein